MFSDGVVDLVEQGAITNAKKTIQTGKIVGGFCVGTQRLYDFLNDNPLVGQYQCTSLYVFHFVFQYIAHVHFY